MTYNPALADERLAALRQEFIPESQQPLTMEGVLEKTGKLAGVTILAGIISSIFFGICGFVEIVLPITLIIALVTIVLAWMICADPVRAKSLAYAFAVLEGISLGILTQLFEFLYPGIGVQALILTFVITLGSITLYRTNLIQDKIISLKFCRVGLLALFFSYMFSFVAGMLGWECASFLNDNPLIDIGIRVAAVIFFSYVLLGNLKVIRGEIRKGTSKEHEYYFAFSILLTMINIYLELLRLLAKTRRR
ncbi:MAG: Bax inhibitor-1/YccA family protein [Candidatus Bruticola sp.]